jgi:hypothetical protein
MSSELEDAKQSIKDFANGLNRIYRTMDDISTAFNTVCKRWPDATVICLDKFEALIRVMETEKLIFQQKSRQVLRDSY